MINNFVLEVTTPFKDDKSVGKKSRMITPKCKSLKVFMMEVTRVANCNEDRVG